MFTIISHKKCIFKSQWYYLYTSTRMAKAKKKKVTTPDVGNDAEKLNNSRIAGEMLNLYAHFGNSLSVYYKFQYTVTRGSSNYIPR